MKDAASVPMKELTFVFVIATPVINPRRPPKSTPRMTPPTRPTALMALTVMIADAVATAAIDRSKIPAMMQTVVVAARISRTDD